MKMNTQDAVVEVDGEILLFEKEIQMMRHIIFNYSQNGCYTVFIIWFKNRFGYRPGNERIVNLGKTGCFLVLLLFNMIKDEI